MIIWKGFGFVVPIIGIVAFVALQFMVDAILGAGYYSAAGWPKLIAAMFAAAAILGAGIFLDQPGKIVVEKETGREIELKKKHSLFFIPVKFWSIIVLALGAWMAFA